MKHWRGQFTTWKLVSTICVRLTIPQILRWADRYRRTHERWPAKLSGMIPNSDGETWTAVAMVLRKGLRGLPGGNSLRKLLVLERGAKIPRRSRR